MTRVMSVVWLTSAILISGGGGEARAELETPQLTATIVGEAAARPRVGDTLSLAGENPVHVRIMWTEDPQHRATISWSTADMDRPQRVRYDTESRGGEADAYRFRMVANHSGPFDDAQAAFFHHAHLGGLEPLTTYYFVVVSGDKVSREFHFTTAPADHRDFSLLYGGDSRSDPLARCRVNLTIAAMAEADPQLLAVVHGGDYVANGRSWPQWLEWLDNHQLTIPESGRILPFIAARGNHDGGILYDQVFGFPGLGQNYFTTTLSPMATLVTTNSEISTAGDQKQWLNDQLGKLRDKTQWLMVQYHRPAFPAVKSPSTVRQNWVPLFERHNVDLVMEADGHCIKRTLPIRNDKPAKDGVVYIGEGGFGVPQRTPDNNRWYLRPPGMVDRGHHVTHLHFTPERLRMRVITLDPSGGVADDHSLVVREKHQLKEADREKALEKAAKQATEKPTPAPVGSQ